MTDEFDHADPYSSTMSEGDRKVIIASITRMLARREHSVQEIISKLSQKGVEEDAICKDAAMTAARSFIFILVTLIVINGKGRGVFRHRLQPGLEICIKR